MSVSWFMASLPPPPTTASRAAATGAHAGGTTGAAGTRRTTIHSAGTHPSRSAWARRASVADAITASTVSTAVTCTAASVSTSVASVIPYSASAASVVANPTSVVPDSPSIALAPIRDVLARICLAVGHRRPSSCAAVFIGCRAVRVRCTTAMLRVVLPSATVPATSRDTIATLDVRVAVEIVISVYGDVVVSAPSRSCSPSPPTTSLP